MEYRFNTYNEDYIMLSQFDIFNKIAELVEKENKTKEDNKILKIIQNIINCTFSYRNEKGKKTYIEEIAIDKHSELGSYIITQDEKKRTYISIEDAINALLICIEKEDWEYYNELTETVKKMKQLKINKIDIIDFVPDYEITNYIINNSRIIPKTYSSNHDDQNVYLYYNKKIIKTKLMAPTKATQKRKKRTI